MTKTINSLSGVYKILNKENNYIYIGSSKNMSKRWSIHTRELKKNLHKNNYLQKAFNKYGKENFIFEIVEVVSDFNNLIIREQFYIDTLKPKYNIRKIAESNLGLLHSKETKEKISNKLIGRFLTEEHKLNVSISKKDKPQTFEAIMNRLLAREGYKHSEETKKKIGLSNKGKKHINRKLSDSHKEKLSLVHKNKTLSLDTRKKISESKKGKPWTINRINAQKIKTND